MQLGQPIWHPHWSVGAGCMTQPCTIIIGHGRARHCGGHLEPVAGCGAISGPPSGPPSCPQSAEQMLGENDGSQRALCCRRRNSGASEMVCEFCLGCTHIARVGARSLSLRDDQQGRCHGKLHHRSRELIGAEATVGGVLVDCVVTHSSPDRRAAQ